jgi:sugar (pentulose or hexulose) kinase
MEKYIIAIDGGTQSTKLAVFDTSGHEICSETVPLRPIQFYGDNRAEHPDDDLWESLKSACQACLKNLLETGTTLSGWVWAPYGAAVH